MLPGSLNDKAASWCHRILRKHCYIRDVLKTGAHAFGNYADEC